MFDQNLSISKLLASSQEYLRPYILGLTDYTSLYTMPRSYILLQKLGNVETFSDPKLLIERRTGIRRMHSPAVILHCPALNDTTPIDFDMYLSNGVASLVRPGMLFEVSGLCDGDTPAHFSLHVENRVVGNTYNVRTVSTVQDAGATADAKMAASSYTMYLSSLEDWSDMAPQGFSIAPDYTENWVQMIRFSYKLNGMTASANKIFSAIKQNSDAEARDLLFGALEYSFLNSPYPCAPDSAQTSIGGTTVGLDFDGGKMGGIPFLLGTSDLSASNTKYYGQTVAYNTLAGILGSTDGTANNIVTGLREWAMQFNDEGRLLAFCSGEMIRLLEGVSAMAFGANLQQVPRYIEFPEFSIYGRDINLGRITITLVEVGALDSGTTHFVYDGANYANRTWFIYAIDPMLFHTYYHQHEVLGTGVPNPFKIEQYRSAGSIEEEWRARVTCGLLDQHKQGVFFLYYTDPNPQG